MQPMSHSSEEQLKTLLMSDPAFELILGFDS